MKLLKSFQNAFRGLRHAIRTQRNMRIHLVAVVCVTALGFLAKLDGPRWGLVALCFGTVLAAELVNTALEQICDALRPEHDPKVGLAKDIAAAAVLVLAITSVTVACVIFIGKR